MVIYVGNLNYNLQEEDVKQIFAEFGEVESVKIIRDRETGRAKGFGFVEMPNETEASAAMQELNGKEVQGRNIKVDKYRQSAPRQGGNFHSGGNRSFNQRRQY